jgi:ATP-dependent Zn protease
LVEKRFLTPFICAHEIDEAVVRLLNEAEERAAGIVQGHPAELARLIERLEHEETLDRSQIDACLGPAHGRQGHAEPPAAAAE